MNMRLLQQLDRAAEVFQDQCEKRKLWLLIGFSIMYWGGTCVLASRKLMWNDEFFTFYISRLPSVADIWSALLTGADQIPPFFHIVTHASFSLFGVHHLSIRLPEMLGFWVMSLCLFQFVSKRSSALYGLAAMLFPLVTVAYYYAYEARPYGLVLGFGGLSLLCWQSAAEGNYRKLSLIGLAVSLAAAVSSHYYAVLLFFPLALGEVARSLSRRRLDLPIWIAFALALTPLLLFLPLIERANTYAATFWGKPHWGAIPGFYYFLLIPALLPLVATLILSAVDSTTHPIGSSGRNQGSRPTPLFHEIAAAFGFVVIPVVAVILAKLVTDAFTSRYALPSVIGFSILLAFSAYRLLDGRAIVGVALVLFYCSWFTALEVKYFQYENASVLSQIKTYDLLRSESENSLPIVVSDAHTFMILTYYAPRDIASRVIYLADPEMSLRHLGHTTVDQGILDLKPWFRLKVEEYGPYVASQQRFLVYGKIGNFNGLLSELTAANVRISWLLSELIAANMQIELKGQNGNSLLFLVSRKE
jgi:hypothetical protein